jgi:hypothetical protein
VAGFVAHGLIDGRGLGKGEAIHSALITSLRSWIW